MNKMIADRYMIVTSLGEGGMADVYLAIDTILNREVAIKILRGELSSDPVTLLRFQREANAASKLNHPNVVDVYDVGESDGKHYIVMEYVRGRTLKQLISQRGALDKKEAVDIMIQLTSAVQHAHENNIIHRDIKPQNVLVKDDGTIKITDFGIALAHDAVQLTQSDAVLGSAHYLAPETTRGEAATYQIDIYALGIVFYELLSGSVPFKGENPVQIAMKHLREEMPSIREFNPTLPQSIENIVTKATVKNRKLRYLHASDMLKDLKLCLLPEYEHVDKLVFADEDELPTLNVYHRKDIKQPKEQNNIEEQKVMQKEKPRKSPKALIIALVTIVITLGIATALYFSNVVPWFANDPSIQVPDVMNITKEEAITKLLAAGFKEKDITFSEGLSDDIEDGKVYETKPAIGELAHKSQGVTVMLSNGNYFVMEDYKGKNIDVVTKQIKDKYPKANVQIEEWVPTKEDSVGTILSQSGPEVGSKLDPTLVSNIYFKVASAPRILLQDIVGKKVEDAMSALKDAGMAVISSKKLTVGMSEEELAKIEKGVVVEVSPEEGTTYIQEGENVITLYYY